MKSYLRSREHRECGEYVKQYGFSLLLLWGEMSGAYRDGAVGAGMNKEAVMIFEQKKELADYLYKNVKDNDVVLVKGSRSTKMEEIVEKLKEEEE